MTIERKEVFFNMLSNRGSLDFKYDREWIGDNKIYKWFEVKESYNNRLLGTIEFEYKDEFEEVQEE